MSLRKRRRLIELSHEVRGTFASVQAAVIEIIEFSPSVSDDGGGGGARRIRFVSQPCGCKINLHVAGRSAYSPIDQTSVTL